MSACTEISGRALVCLRDVRECAGVFWGAVECLSALRCHGVHSLECLGVHLNDGIAECTEMSREAFASTTIATRVFDIPGHGKSSKFNPTIRKWL